MAKPAACSASRRRRRPGAVIANTPLFFQSPDVGTAQLFYENYGISARLAYSYRSAYLDTVASSSAADPYTDANDQLDLRVAYDINTHIQMFAEGSNLNDATGRPYQSVERQTAEEERYSWSARIGATVKY
jgi:hypothetical protein